MKRFAVLMALTWVACAGGSHAPALDADVGDAGDEDAVLELGSGETAFEPTSEAQHLKLYAGTQGGHHVWLSFRTQGLLPEDVRMALDVVPSPPARAARSEVTIDLDRPSDGAPGYEFIGWPARVLDPECAVGSVVSIALTLTDERGRQVSGSMTVIPDPPDLGFSRACMQ